MTQLATPLQQDDWTRLSPASALAFTARVVNSSLRLDDVLRTVVRLTCQVLDADRATILLLDPEQRLMPAASDGRVDDPEAFARFRQMLPVSLPSIPHALELLSSPKVLAMPDVSASPLIPAAWTDAFGLKSLLLAPIVTHGEILGALVVDYAEQRGTFDANEILILEGIAACTSTALRNARLHHDVVQRAQNLDESLRVTAQLNAATSTRAVCDVALDGLLRLLDAEAASVHLLSDAGVVTLASRGAGHPEPGRHTLLPDQRVAGDWFAGPRDAGDELRQLPPFRDLPQTGLTVLLPLTDPPPPGFVLLTCRTTPTSEAWRVAQSMAGQVMLALDRARLTEETQRRLEHLETSYRLADELAPAADLDAVVAYLADPVRRATRCEVIDVLLSPARASARFTARAPGATLAQLMRAWLRCPPTRPVEHDDLLLVPMLLDAQLVGILRLRPHRKRLDPADEGFLLAVAGGVAGLVTRADLNAQVGAAQRELAVVQERERIARDLHDTLGQTLFALGLQLSTAAEVADPEEVRREIERARASTDAAALQLRQAIHALAFLRRNKASLTSCLRALAAEAATGLNVRVSCTGRAVAVPAATTDALLRVAREGLLNVERHARATEVALTLRYEHDAVELTIADNGTGLAQRSAAERSGLHFGLRTMRRRIEEVGGTLRFHKVAPHGLRVLARVPLR